MSSRRDKLRKKPVENIYTEEEVQEEEDVPDGGLEDLNLRELDDDEVDEDDRIDKEEARKQKLLSFNKTQNDLLFLIQGVGEIKTINNLQIYVKNKDCEFSLKNLIKIIQRDDLFQPLIKQALGEWNFLQNELIPLMKFHNKDKKLSFLSLMIMVLLTEYPKTSLEEKAGLSETKIYSWTHKKSSYRNPMLEILRGYKEAFINSKTISVLVEHLADCLQTEQRTNKHDQMIELILVLFKQLLQIPDSQPGDTNTLYANKNLQKKLLMAYSQETVLDSFNFLSQEFETIFQKKLCVQILDIQYHIFKGFSAKDLFCDEEQIKKARSELFQQQFQEDKRLRFYQRMRSSKFGTQISMQRPDGTKAIISNIYQKNIDITSLGEHQRMKVNRQGNRALKNNQIDHEKSLISIETLQEEDKILLEIMKNYLQDIFDNTYNQIINELSDQIIKSSPQSKDDQDRFNKLFDRIHFFKIQGFMIEVLRQQALDSHRKKQIAAIDQQDDQKKLKEQEIKNLFDVNKKASIPQQKAQKVNVPFEIQIDCIGASLQIQSFEFLFNQLYRKSKLGEKEISHKEYHSALQYLIQFLYIIRDMASSNDEKNLKNARILQTNIFHKDLMNISLYSFKMYDARCHSQDFLFDIVEFTHIMLEMLDEYSKGKILMIQTQKTRKIKKKNKNAVVLNVNNVMQDYEESDEGINKNENDEYGEEEDEQDEENIEREFNFVGEFVTLVQYPVVSKYLYIIQKQLYEKKPVILKACTNFFKRIVIQAKQQWIFFQLETLSIFNDFLQQDQGNNQLMKGILSKKVNTAHEREIYNYKEELKNILKIIISKFLTLIQTNKMLGVEILFEFQSREIKDAILSNYSGVQPNQQKLTQQQIKPKPNNENVIDFNNFGEQPVPNNIEEKNNDEQILFDDNEDDIQFEDDGLIWTAQMDDILISNYKDFKDLDKISRFELLTALIPGSTSKDCMKRAKKLKLKEEDEEASREISRNLIATHFRKRNKTICLIFFQQKMREGKITFQNIFENIQMIEKIIEEYEEFEIDFERNKMIATDFERREIERWQQRENDRDEKYSLFTFVPLSRKDFEILESKSFSKLLSLIGIENSLNKGNVFPKILQQLDIQKSKDFIQEIKSVYAFAEQKDIQEKFNQNDIFDKSLIKKIQEEYIIQQN